MKLILFLLTMLNLNVQNPEPKKSLTNTGKIELLVQILADAWTSADGQKFASVFASEHDFITWHGFYSPNLTVEGNAEGHQKIFDHIYKNTEYHYHLDKIRFITSDVAVIHVYAALSQKGEPCPPDPYVLWTAVVKKTHDDWKIVSFHNLDLVVFKDKVWEERSPMPIKAMYKGWYENKGI